MSNIATIIKAKVKTFIQIAGGLALYLAISIGIIIFLTWPFFVIGSVTAYFLDHYSYELPFVVKLILIVLPYLGTWFIVPIVGDRRK